MKITYLHGLESTQGGPKVQYLLDQGHEVYAPALPYKTDPQLFAKTLAELRDFQPDYIIGSSMGGYFAYYLCRLLDCKGILLNPALQQRSFEMAVDDSGSYTPDLAVYLGKQDELIPPADTERFLKKNYKGFVVVVQREYGHRTPYEQFVKIVDGLGWLA